MGILTVLFAVTGTATSQVQVNEADAKLVSPKLTSPEAQTAVRGSLTFNLRNKLGRPLTGISVEIRTLQSHAVLISARSGQDGSLHFQELPMGEYELTVAGGILPPRQRVQVNGSHSATALTLPISQPPTVGTHAVSIHQLSVPAAARQALSKANDAWQRRDWKKARELIQRAMSLYSSYGAALALLGFLDLQEGKAELAANDLRQAIEYDPDSALAYLTLGSAYNSLQQYGAALQALSVFPSVSPDMWQVHYETARSYMGIGNFEIALREINFAQQLSHEDPMALHLGKAHALLALHRTPEAASELQTIVRNDPNGPFAEEARTFLASLPPVKQ